VTNGGRHIVPPTLIPNAATRGMCDAGELVPAPASLSARGRLGVGARPKVPR